MLLNNLLALEPLDRVQIYDREEIKNLQHFTRFSPQFEHELPFYFMQRALNDGRIEVRQPGGYAKVIWPHDIADIRRGKPLIVRAMPRAVFLKRHSTYQVPPVKMDDFFEAYVLYVEKDRWNRVDRVFCHFLDNHLNDKPTPWSGAIHPTDLERVREAARRTRMPVVSTSQSLRCHHSANQGIRNEMSTSQYIVRGFLESALSGRKSAVRALSDSDINPISIAKCNRLLSQPG